MMLVIRSYRVYDDVINSLPSTPRNRIQKIFLDDQLSRLSGLKYSSIELGAPKFDQTTKARSSGYGWRLNLKGCGFESWRRKLDGKFSHWFVVKLYCLFEKIERYEKEAGIGPNSTKQQKALNWGLTIANWTYTIAQNYKSSKWKTTLKYENIYILINLMFS